MVKNTYGLDLGSYEIKVYDKKKDTIWKEKNVIAIRDQRDVYKRQHPKCVRFMKEKIRKCW